MKIKTARCLQHRDITEGTRCLEKRGITGQPQRLLDTLNIETTSAGDTGSFLAARVALKYAALGLANQNSSGL